MIKPIQAIISSIEQRSANPNSLIATGFPTIDSKYFGFAPKELWVLGAYTGSFKSYFCLQLALNLILSKRRVLYFSLEMPSEALLARIWGNLSGLSATKLEFGMLDIEEFAIKEKAKDQLLTLSDLLYFDDSSYSLPSIKNTITDLIRICKKPDLIILDFIQNLQGVSEEYQRLSNSIVEIQKYSKQFDASILVVSQVSNVEAKEGANSKIIGYKGSGGLAAAADFGLWLEKKTEFEKVSDSQQVDLYFRKVRRGPNFRIQLEVEFPGGKVKEKNDGF